MTLENMSFGRKKNGNEYADANGFRINTTLYFIVHLPSAVLQAFV